MRIRRVRTVVIGARIPQQLYDEVYASLAHVPPDERNLSKFVEEAISRELLRRAQTPKITPETNV